jgi:hypothetical protein
MRDREFCGPESARNVLAVRFLLGRARRRRQLIAQSSTIRHGAEGTKSRFALRRPEGVGMTATGSAQTYGLRSGSDRSEHWERARIIGIISREGGVERKKHGRKLPGPWFFVSRTRTWRPVLLSTFRLPSIGAAVFIASHKNAGCAACESAMADNYGSPRAFCLTLALAPVGRPFRSWPAPRQLCIKHADALP